SGMGGVGFRDGQVKVVGGIVTGLSRRHTKRGELMATFFLEDLAASIEVFVFPKMMQVYGSLIADDTVVIVKGRVDTREEQVKLICMEISCPTLQTEGSTELRLKLPLNALSDGLLEELKSVLIGHPGGEPVYLNLGETTLRLPAEFNVDSRKGLVGELISLLGAGAVISGGVGGGGFGFFGSSSGAAAGAGSGGSDAMGAGSGIAGGPPAEDPGGSGTTGESGSTGGSGGNGHHRVPAEV
ncbi:MAG: OB-fold nucleic acid binding domain-containing protein, partial [Acidimicrobiales bacterium]